MMLTSILVGNGPRAQVAARVAARSVVLDLAIFAGFAAIAATLFFQGGAEALAGAALGAVLGAHRAHWRNARFAGALSGAFSGFFAGALFASFFHGAIAALF